MKTRWKILIGLGIFLLLGAVSVWFSAHLKPSSAVDEYKKHLQSIGEKLTLEELIPPPVPVASNSLLAVQGAFGMFGSGNENIPKAMEMIAPGRALVGWRQPDARSYDFTNSWEELTAQIAIDRPALELLHQVLEKPVLDFQLDYKNGVLLLLPHLAPMKKAAQKLAASAILSLHNNDTGATATNILIMLALVQKNGSEGLLISHLVRIAMASIAVMPTWELLQTTNVTDAQLGAVQNGWEQLDFLGDATNTFVFERAWGIHELKRLRATPGAITALFSGGWSGAVSAWSWPPDWEAITETPRNVIGETLWRTSWSYSDELQTMQEEQAILEALRAIRTNSGVCLKTNYDALQAQLARMKLMHSSPSRAFCRALKIPDFGEMAGVWGLGSTVGKTLRIETAQRIVITAIALKRFQLKHGHLPEKLSELAPEFLPSVPIDPYSGKPLCYRLHADGSYLLYSVAENGADDGGDAAVSSTSASPSFQWQNAQAPDWVWPQPATAEEIKDYHDAEAAKAAANAAMLELDENGQPPPFIETPPPAPPGTN